VKIQTRQALVALSIFLAMLFILVQFLFVTVGSAGPWCFPYLGAPQELARPSYQFVRYGFPMPVVDVRTGSCFEEPSTTYKWSPLGLAINSFLLILIAYPIWPRNNKVNAD